MSLELPAEQARLLEALAAPGNGAVAEERIPDLAKRLGLDQAQVMAAATLLAGQGFVAFREEAFREWQISPDGRAAAETGIPERRILRALLEHSGQGTLAEVASWSGLDPKEVGQSLKGLERRGWAKKAGASLELTAAGQAQGNEAEADEGVLALLSAKAEQSAATDDDLRAAGLDAARALELLGPRSKLVEIRDRVHRWVSLTPQGADARRSGVRSQRVESQLTPEMLASGEWRQVKLKAYDIELGTEPAYPGKRHPLQQILARTRRAFLDMGFSEVASPYVESSFWNFDALFQPQDHPAREMQDTFYVERPGRTALPESSRIVERVQAAHETGGDTGSIGWQYPWSRERAEKNVLRTHTTAATIRALAEQPGGPRKVFCIGQVFRRETIDYKHLPVFTQVDGIIIDAAASFANLLGTLAAFYERMGFQKFYFRPGFFPYTEPSVEVFIWHEAKQDWFEMGGAGVFRPEVTEPLGCKEPVLAWGLGLERLAMLQLDLQDIRDLYLADVEWLKGVPRCR